LVALAILVVMAALFMTVFGSSVKNIYSSGVKSKSFVSISEEIEKLYSMQPFTDEEEISNKLSIKGNEVKLVEKEKLYDKPEGKDFNFLIETNSKNGIKGYNVTFVYFYNNRENYVTITTFFRGE